MNETPEIRKRHNSSFPQGYLVFIFGWEKSTGFPPPTIPFYFILFIYLTLLRKEIKISGENVVIKMPSPLFIILSCLIRRYYKNRRVLGGIVVQSCVLLTERYERDSPPEREGGELTIGHRDMETMAF